MLYMFYMVKSNLQTSKPSWTKTYEIICKILRREVNNGMKA